MKKYDEDYKQEAVRKVHDGQSVASVSRKLGVSESLLHKRSKQALEAATDSEREIMLWTNKQNACDVLCDSYTRR